MAQPMTLVQSFYEWLAKVERKLRDARTPSARRAANLLPIYRPTSLLEVREVSASACSALQGTSFHERAVYWLNLFTGIVTDGWREPVEEGVLDAP